MLLWSIAHCIRTERYTNTPILQLCTSTQSMEQYQKSIEERKNGANLMTGRHIRRIQCLCGCVFEFAFNTGLVFHFIFSFNQFSSRSRHVSIISLYLVAIRILIHQNQSHVHNTCHVHCVCVLLISFIKLQFTTPNS